MAAAVHNGNSRLACRASRDEPATVQAIVTASAPAAMTVSHATGTRESNAPSRTDSATRIAPIASRTAGITRPRRYLPSAAPMTVVATRETSPSGM